MRTGRAVRSTVAALALMAVKATAALAGTAGGATGTMPWTAPLQAVLDDISGPTGKVLAGLAIAIGGAVWGFTRHEQGVSRFGQAIVGIGLILGAANVVAVLNFQGCLL
jgi:type IV secretory pathway VirB2 component (pilin)